MLGVAGAAGAGTELTVACLEERRRVAVAARTGTGEAGEAVAAEEAKCMIGRHWIARDILRQKMGSLD